MIQQILVYVVIAAALLFALRRLAKRFKKGDDCSSCSTPSNDKSGCQGCPLSKDKGGSCG